MFSSFRFPYILYRMWHGKLFFSGSGPASAAGGPTLGPHRRPKQGFDWTRCDMSHLLHLWQTGLAGQGHSTASSHLAHTLRPVGVTSKHTPHLSLALTDVTSKDLKAVSCNTERSLFQEVKYYLWATQSPALTDSVFIWRIDFQPYAKLHEKNGRGL